MKTTTLQLMLFVCTVQSFGFTTHSPPVTDTVIIQFKTGAGVDCRNSSRECLWAQTVTTGEVPDEASEAIAKAWFDGAGRFVLEITQALKPGISGELQSGSFRLDGDIPLPGELLFNLNKQGQTIILRAGEYPVSRQFNGNYRIVFQ